MQLFPVEILPVTDRAGATVEQIVAEEVISPPRGEYALVDVDGYLGIARILPERTRGYDGNDGSTGAPPFHVELEWVGTPAHVPSRNAHVVAIGPALAASRRSRRMQAGLALAGEVYVGRDEEKAATGPKGAPTYAVDLDGDGTADVVSYVVTSHDTETRDHLLTWSTRAETWLREGGVWRQLERCTWHGRTIVGP
jgi:hypothetical protein